MRKVDETNFGNVPASNLGVADEIENLSKTKLGSHYDINDKLEDISDKVEKAIEVNIELQDKITRLGQAIAVLGSEIKQLASAGKLEPQSMPKRKNDIRLPAIPPSPLDLGEFEKGIPQQATNQLAGQIKLLAEQNIELVNALKSIDTKLSKGDTNERIRKALERTGVM